MTHSIHSSRGDSRVRRSRFIVSLALGALVAGGAACKDDNEPPFAPEGFGSVAGLLFEDADVNGRFSPLGGDQALANVPIEIRMRGTDSVLAATTTDAEGRFAVTGLPPGTHDIIALTEGDATGLKFCAQSQASVYIGEQAFVAIAARVACVVPITEAESQDLGVTVTVVGTVTASQGTFRGDNVYIQDETSGIQVIGLAAGLGLDIGDEIEVTGTLIQFGQEREVGSPLIVSRVTARGDTIAPRPTTAAEINAIPADVLSRTRDPLVGSLIVLQGVRLGAFTTTGGPPPTGANAAVVGMATQVRLDGNVYASGLRETRFNTTSCYNITGVLGFFSPNLQLKPRGPSDVVEVPCAP